MRIYSIKLDILKYFNVFERHYTLINEKWCEKNVKKLNENLETFFNIKKL